MRYAGGYDSSRPWNETTNPLRLRYTQPWRLGGSDEFDIGSVEAWFPPQTQTSDYLYQSGFETEASALSKRGYIEPFYRQQYEPIAPELYNEDGEH